MSVQGAFPGLEEDLPPIEVARVLVDTELPHLDKLLDYRVPDELLNEAQVGHTVKVTLAGRSHTGWIIERELIVPEQRSLRPIEAVISHLPVITPELLEYGAHVAKRSLATLPQVLSVAIPPRHAGAEASIAKSSSTPTHPQDAVIDVAGEGWLERPQDLAWSTHEFGVAFIHALAAGKNPRGVWAALPGNRDEQSYEAIAACLYSGRRVLIIEATHQRVEAVAAQLTRAFPRAHVGTLHADLSAQRRYSAYLTAIRGQSDILVGTRSAVWTPLPDIGLILLWDDGDDRLREQRSPRVDALDVSVARAHLQGCALLVGAWARSVKAQSLVASRWAQSLHAGWEERRKLAPHVSVPDEFDREREGISAQAQIPSSAQRMLRQALQEGPVLVQVPLSGYAPAIACQRCRKPARCAHCHGVLSVTSERSIVCSWCSRDTERWRCPQCSHAQLRAFRVGSDRTAEDLGRAFPGIPLTVSSSQRGVVERVSDQPRVVVATPGAEPAADGGYAAVLIVDAPAIADRSELWAPQEALRRWMNACALTRCRSDHSAGDNAGHGANRHAVRSAGQAMVVGGVEPILAQSLIRWDPTHFAERALEERVDLAFFPAATIVAIDGPLGEVEELIRELSAVTECDHVGTVPRKSSFTSDEGDADPLSAEVRALVRATRARSGDLLDALREMQQIRSAHKRPMLRMSVNPPELF